MADWIFQSKADYFDLPGALAETPRHDNLLTFLAVQCFADIIPGDTVYLCFAGRKSPGLYATATVLTRPAGIMPEDWQRNYAMKQLPADEKAEAPLRVRLRIERVLDEPVARGDLYSLPELEGHKFVTAHIGTNFPLTPEQARAIDRLMAAPRAQRAVAMGGKQPSSARITAGRLERSGPNPLQNIHETHLEGLIASDLDQIEPGLTLIGRQYDAGAAGRIDLLCHSSGGDIVVVELKRMDARAAGVIEQTMAYVGWARKHLAGPNQQVRGIIIGGKPDARLKYAVEGIPNLKLKILNISIGDSE